MDNDCPSRNLRRKGIIDYKENNNIATTSQSPSTTTSRKRKYNCFCGKDNNNKLTYCYGPSCPWGWVHIKCLGLQDEPRRAFCSEKCKNDEVALMADENAVFQNYDWCSCRKNRGGEMLECSKRTCKIKWYHLGCVGLQSLPENAWICESCSASAPKNIKKRVTFAETSADEDLSEGYCICKKKPDDRMIECGSPQCTKAWFHLACINLNDFPAPDTYWCCSDECKNQLNSCIEEDS